MAFNSYQKHCTKCKKSKPCSQRHIYVMELDSKVLELKKFKETNPNYEQGMPCVYVGKSIHHPKCRQSMHNNCKPGSWQGKKWTCYCKKKPGINEATLATRSSSVVGKYMTGYLLPQLYKSVNPQRGPNNNSMAEEILAAELRSQGYGVWAGHHDSKSKFS